MTHVVDTYELSPMQAGMLFHTVSAPDSPIYIEQVIVTLTEPLDELHFVRAWQRVVERHPVLRSRFRWKGVAEPVQDVVDRVQISVERFDWRALAEAERHRRFQALQDHERIRGFDLGQAPLMRLVLVRAADSEHWVLWTTHHAIVDGRSRFLLWQEVFTFYEGFLRGGDADLPLPRPYRDYIEWLRKFDYDSAKTYWQGVLAGFRAPTPLLVARDRDTGDAAGGVRRTNEIRLSTALTTALRKRAREASVTLNILLQGAWALLLHRYSGESDIVFGVTRAGRGSALDGSGDMFGLFINTLPIRVSIDPESELVPWLRQFRPQQVALRDYEHTPLVKVQGWSEVPGGTPLFESILVFDTHTLDAQLRALGGAWSKRRFQIFGDTHYPLTVVAYGDQELLLQLEYSRRRFDDEIIARMLGHLRTLLEGMAAQPQAKLKDLPLLTGAERHQVLEVWNETSEAYPPARCVHELVEEQASIRPEALAAAGGGRKVSYRELNEQAERLAERLRGHGVRSGSLVAIYLERSLEMLVGLLGVWKAGGAYVPIDPEYPAERVRYMLEDAQAVAVLTQKSLSGALRDSSAVILDLDAEEALPAASPEHRAKRFPMSAEQLAYVIYTSGSTGRPKGVPITHGSLCNLIYWHQQAYAVTPAERATQIAGPAFDASVWEIWPYLTAGASVHIPDDATRLDPRKLVRWLIERRITLTFLPTPLAEAALRESWPEDGALRVLLTGGDRLNQRPVQKLPFRLVNHYGPAENTVVSTCAEVKAGASSAPPPIGRPLPNTRAYVVDAHLQPLPIGVPGELLVGGVQLTSGYWNRPELTAEKFIPDPFRTELGARLYKTGDRVRFLPDGDIEFLGRIDNQVKIRGFRIELGEIESGIARHPAVREVVVIAREDTPGDKRLVAYVAAANPPADLLTQLRAHIRASMPEYMVPAHFVILDALPLTPNGKVDHRGLPDPESDATETGREFVEPRDATERVLCRIWAETLKRDRVGIDDDFFAIGGHSLLAAKLFSRLDEQFGRSLPLGVLFSAPTVRALAEHYRTAPQQQFRALVALRKSGSLTPVFAVPGVYGNVLGLAELCRELGPDQPFYGLQSLGLDGSNASITTIEEMAALYTTEMRTVQPNGPYVLIGLCFGATVAYEMARQLLAEGLDIAYLGLLEPSRREVRDLRDAPASTPRILMRAAALGDFVSGRLQLYLEEMNQLNREGRINFVVRKLRSLGASVKQWKRLAGARRDLNQIDVYRSNIHALDRYQRKPLNGKLKFLEIFETSRSNSAATNDSIDWAAFQNDSVTRHLMPGNDSGDMVSETNVGFVAARLKERLQLALSRKPIETPGERNPLERDVSSERSAKLSGATDRPMIRVSSSQADQRFSRS